MAVASGRKTAGRLGCTTAMAGFAIEGTNVGAEGAFKACIGVITGGGGAGIGLTEAEDFCANRVAAGKGAGFCTGGGATIL
ncbi:MAG: hypothetical protein K0R52_1614 [Alphaproteobacteria bacterium]|nr:hypothetical protein [Alphaproteobacteria bacterium]